MRDPARDVIPLVCAAACVGIITGAVTLTGAGTRFPSLILPIAQTWRTRRGQPKRPP